MMDEAGADMMMEGVQPNMMMGTAEVDMMMPRAEDMMMPAHLKRKQLLLQVVTVWDHAYAHSQAHTYAHSEGQMHDDGHMQYSYEDGTSPSSSISLEDILPLFTQ